jgi:hypothetical protein
MSRTSRQDEFLAAARKGQATMIEAIRTWVETVRALTPKLPSVHAPFADRFPSLPSISLPSTRLPRAEEAVASGFDLAQKLLASQRRFAEDILNATKPLMPGYGQQAPEDGGSAAPQERTATLPEGTAAPRENAASPRDTNVPSAPAATPADEVPAAVRADQAPKTASARQAPKAPSARQGRAARQTPKTPAARQASKTPSARQAPSAGRAPKRPDAS